MNRGLIAATLIDCIAAMPCGADRRPRARITKVEKAKIPAAMAPERRRRARMNTALGIPDPGRGRVVGVLGKVARLAAEGALDTVAELGVTAVEDLGEQVAQQADDVFGNVVLGQCRRVVVDRDRDVAQLSAGCPADLADRLGERQQPWAGQLIDAVRVPSAVSAATATSAMSSASMNGSRTSPAGSATSPPSGSCARLGPTRSQRQLLLTPAAESCLRDPPDSLLHPHTKTTVSIPTPAPR